MLNKTNPNQESDLTKKVKAKNISSTEQTTLCIMDVESPLKYQMANASLWF